MPKTDQTQEDFQWVLREIMEGKGEASICEASFVDGLSNAQIEGLFQSARETDYRQLAEEARQLAKTLSSKKEIKDGQRTQVEIGVSRLRRRFTEIVALDFFGASGREATDGLINGIEARIQKKSGKPAVNSTTRPNSLKGKTWVTRKGIHVDRMASAWLIRRFIDPDAHFKFVPAKDYKPLPDEIRFDMFEAEFTHEGDRCSMEVLINRIGIDDPGLTPIAQIVHDIDLKDSKFGRPETIGIERLIAGIAMADREDETRLTRSAIIFDDLYEYFKRKRS